VYLCFEPHSFSQAIFLASLFPPLLSFASAYQIAVHPLQSLAEAAFTVTYCCWFIGLILSLFATCSAGILATLRAGNQKQANVHGQAQNSESRVDTLYSQAFQGIAVLLFVALVLFVFGLVVFLCWFVSPYGYFLLAVLVPTLGFTSWFLRFTVKLILFHIRKK
jgi:hypothetical protein